MNQDNVQMTQDTRSTVRSVRVPDHIWLAARDAAQYRDETVSAVIVRALRNYATRVRSRAVEPDLDTLGFPYPTPANIAALTDSQVNAVVTAKDSFSNDTIDPQHYHSGREAVFDLDRELDARKQIEFRATTYAAHARREQDGLRSAVRNAWWAAHGRDRLNADQWDALTAAWRAAFAEDTT